MNVTCCDPETPVSSVAACKAFTLFKASVPIFCVVSATPVKVFAAPSRVMPPPFAPEVTTVFPTVEIPPSPKMTPFKYAPDPVESMFRLSVLTPRSIVAVLGNVSATPAAPRVMSPEPFAVRVIGPFQVFDPARERM